MQGRQVLMNILCNIFCILLLGLRYEERLFKANDVVYHRDVIFQTYFTSKHCHFLRKILGAFALHFQQILSEHLILSLLEALTNPLLTNCKPILSLVCHIFLKFEFESNFYFFSEKTHCNFIFASLPNDHRIL